MSKRRTTPVEPEFAEPHMCSTGTRLQILGRVPFFTGLPAEAIERINERFQDRGYNAGEMIYLAGEEAVRLYVVATGKVKLLRHTADGQEIMLDILTPGEHFGSLAALGDAVYPDTAQAHTGVCALSISAEDFRAILEAYPATALRVLDITGARLRDAQERVRQLSAYTVEQRIAAALLKLGEKLGEPHEEGLLIQMPLSREDLAAMTGTTTETASRTLRRFQNDGLINAGRQWVAIADREQLERLAATEAV